MTAWEAFFTLKLLKSPPVQFFYWRVEAEYLGTLIFWMF